MFQKTPEDRGSVAVFPAENYWEELRVGWDDISQDDLSSSHLEARHAALESLAKLTDQPVPEGLIVARAQLAQILKPLSLDHEVDLAERLYLIAGRYRRPQHRAFFGTAAAEVKRRLGELLELASDFDHMLGAVPGEVHLVIDAAAADLAEKFGTRSALRVDDFLMMLTGFTQAVAHVGKSLTLPPNRPMKTVRQQALLDAARALETAAGQRIQTSWSKSSTGKKDAFRGDVGKTLLAFMSILEPGVTEQALVRSLRTSRASAGGSKPSEK